METLKRTWSGGLFGKLLIGCGGLIILACICGVPVAILGGLTGGSDATATPASRLAELPVETPLAAIATSTPMPTFTPVPSPTDFPTNTPTLIQPSDTPIPIDTPIPTDTPAAPPTEEMVVSATVLAEVLNMRSGPGTAYAKVGQVREGDQLVVVACNESCDWFKAGDGWISAEYVETSGELSSLPVATAQPLPTLPPEPTTPPPTQPAPPTGPVIVIGTVNKGAEYVDLQNIGDAPQDLTGWLLRSEKGNQDCTLGGIIQPGETLRIWAMAEDAGEGGYNCGFGTTIWNNDERDPAVLLDAAGNEVDRK